MTKSAPASPTTSSVQIAHYDGPSAPAARLDHLAREEPLEIRIRGRSIAITMRTPGHDAELTAGFLLTEGIVQKAADIAQITHCARSPTPDNTLNVLLSPSLEVSLDRLTRHVFASSSCGVCGKASIEAVRQQFPPCSAALAVSSKILCQLPQKMRAAQATFDQTGGLHAAAIFDQHGELVVLREDVGRHNAVDKAIGYGLLKSLLPFDQHILLVSGRASFEIIQKALAARVPIVCAVSAPSSLAVDFAHENGQTLVGFLRGQTMNVYAGAQRIKRQA